MKHLFLFIVLSFLLIDDLQGQNNSGKVVDNENSLELSEVKIQNISGTFSSFTNATGSFLIPKTDLYIFSKKGYLSKTISVSVNS